MTSASVMPSLNCTSWARVTSAAAMSSHTSKRRAMCAARWAGRGWFGRAWSRMKLSGMWIWEASSMPNHVGIGARRHGA